MTGPVIAALEVSMTGVFMTFFFNKGGGLGIMGVSVVPGFAEDEV